MALIGKHSRVRVLSDADPVPFTEVLLPANEGRTMFQIDDSAKKYWSRENPVVVEWSEDGEVWEPADGCWVQHAGGNVRFLESVDLEKDVRVSAHFVTTTLAVQTREFSMSISNGLLDSTVWGDSWRKKVGNVVDASGTITGFHNVDNLFIDKILDGKTVLIEMDPDVTDPDGTEWSVYAVLNQQELAVAIESIAGATVSWESDGEIACWVKSGAMEPVTPTTNNIEGVQTFDPLHASTGTSFGELSLPNEANVTLEQGTAALGVTWAEEGYDGSIAGSYTLIGTLVLTGIITNTSNITASIVVNVVQGALSITSLESFDGINVPIGTSFEGLGLPADVEATLEDDSTENIPAEWEE